MPRIKYAKATAAAASAASCGEVKSSDTILVGIGTEPIYTIGGHTAARGFMLFAFLSSLRAEDRGREKRTQR